MEEYAQKIFCLKLEIPIEYTDNYQFFQVLFDRLWDIPEAVDDGFKQYYKDNIIKITDALRYHKVNCNGSTDCVICNDLLRIGVKHERPRPELCI